MLATIRLYVEQIEKVLMIRHIYDPPLRPLQYPNKVKYWFNMEAFPVRNQESNLLADGICGKRVRSSVVEWVLRKNPSKGRSCLHNVGGSIPFGSNLLRSYPGVQSLTRLI